MHLTLFLLYWMLLGTTSLLTMVAIGYDRYNVIVKGISGFRMTYPVALLIIISIYAYSTLVCIPPFLGWGGYALGKTKVMFSKKCLTSIFFFLFSRGIVSYMLLWLHVYWLEQEEFLIICFHWELLYSNDHYDILLHSNRQSCSHAWSGIEGPSQENECW